MLKVSELIQKFRPWSCQFIYYIGDQYIKEECSIYSEEDALEMILEKATFDVYAYSYFSDLHLLIMSV